MGYVIQAAIIILMLLGGISLGWFARGIQFEARKECANPKHKDKD